MPRIMRRVTIVCVWAAGLITVLLTALVVAVLLIDADAYRPALQRQLTQALGRTVTAERLSVGLSLKPTIVIRGVSVANPQWASRPQFLVASEGAVTLDLIELIHGRIEIGSISVQGLDLLLEQSGDGTGNWVFSPGEAAGHSGETPTLPNFDAILLRDASITWRDNKGASVDLRIDSAAAVVRADKPLEINASAVFRQTPISADLKANTSLQSVLAGKPVAMSLAVRTEAARADLEIILPKPFDISGLAADFSIAGKRLDALELLAGRSLPGWGPYRLSGKTTFDGDLVRMSGIRLSLEGLPAESPLAVSRALIDAGELSLGRGTPTVARFEALLDDAAFRFEGTTAPIEQILDGTRMVPLEARLAMGDFELGVEGDINALANEWSVDIAAYARGDTSEAVKFLGAPAFRQPLRVDLSARIKADAGQVAVTRLSGDVAKSAISGELEFAQGAPPTLSGALSVGQLDVSAFEVEASGELADEKPKQQTGAPGWITAVNMDLRLRAQEIKGLPVAVSGLSARATIDGGRLGVREFRGSVAEMQVLADAGLQWKRDRPTVDASIRMPVIDIASLYNSKGDTKTGSDAKKNANLDAPLPLAPLRALDADLRFDVGRVDGAPIPIERLKGVMRLVAGRLQLSSLDAALAGVALRSSATLDARSDDARLRATISSGPVNVEKLLAAFKAESSVSGTLESASATLDTHGSSPRAWITGANLAVRAQELQLMLPDREEALVVEKASIISGQGAGTRAQFEGRFGEFPLELTLTGGSLVELLDMKQAWPRLTADLRTTIKQQTVVFTANTSLGPLVAGRNIPLRLVAKSEGGRAALVGTIDDLRNPSRSPFDAQVAVESLSRLPLIFAESPLPDVPFSANGRVLLSDGTIALNGLTARSGQSDLGGDIRFAYKDRRRLQADLSGEVLDLSPWIPEQAEPTADGTAISAVDQPINLQRFREFDGEVRLDIKRLIAPPVELDQFLLEAKLDRSLFDISVKTSEGSSKHTVQLDARKDVAIVAVGASIRGLNMDDLKPAGAIATRSKAPRLSGRAKLVGAGKTLREIRESFVGHVLVFMGPGKIGTGKSPFVIQAVSADLLTTLVPGRNKADEYSELECAAAYFDVKDGVASSPDGIALRFKRVDILGSGAINLATREILFGFKAVRRKWFSLSFLDLAGDFAKIEGTLDQPKVGLDAGNVLVQGGAAWATLGVSLLATNFFRRMSAADDPCAEIVRIGRTAANPVDALTDALRKNLPLPGGTKKKPQ